MSKEILEKKEREKKAPEITSKEFHKLRLEIENKYEALEALFAAAEMGKGIEAELGKEYSRLLSEDWQELMSDKGIREAYGAYDPRTDIREKELPKKLDKYYKSLSQIFKKLEYLESHFDIELETARTLMTVKDTLGA